MLVSVPRFVTRGLRNEFERWHGGCNQTGMKANLIAHDSKLKRSEFFHSLDLVWPTNQLRKARMDFWGGVMLVCVLGIIGKFAQALLSH
jgi:hypothetical protein